MSDEQDSAGEMALIEQGSDMSATQGKYIQRMVNLKEAQSATKEIQPALASMDAMCKQIIELLDRITITEIKLNRSLVGKGVEVTREQAAHHAMLKQKLPLFLDGKPTITIEDLMVKMLPGG